MLKISIGSGAFIDSKKSAEAMQRIRNIGYDALDHQSFCTEPGTGLYSFNESDFEAFLKRDADYAKQIGLDIIQTHGPWPFDDTKKELYDLKFEAMVKSIKGSAILGAEYVVFHPFSPSGWAPSPKHDEEVKANIEYTRLLLPYAKEYNVKIALENMPCANMPAGTVKELVDTIDAIDSEYCVACLDTGHANYLHTDSGEAVLMLGDRLGCLHIHDNNGQTDSHCMPFTHGINWQSFINALKKIKYSGVINLETVSFNGPQALRAEYDALLYKTAKYIAEQVSE